MSVKNFEDLEIRITNALRERANGSDNEAAAVLLQHIRAVREFEATLAWEKEQADERRIERELDDDFADEDDDAV